ncbi:hypothetical protein [Streptomyces sp. I8-5]|uniref:hypothetical protein n=1 Tax=Streptomyces sp. I8-5 TaxID=3104277 RepID=UPI00386D80B3
MRLNLMGTSPRVRVGVEILWSCGEGDATTAVPVLGDPVTLVASEGSSGSGLRG